MREELYQDVPGWTIDPGRQYTFSFEHAYQPIDVIDGNDSFYSAFGDARAQLRFYGDTTGDGVPNANFFSSAVSNLAPLQEWRVHSGSFTMPSVPGQPDVPLLQSTTVRVAFTVVVQGTSDSHSYVGIDDLELRLVPVPEPTTPLLFSLASLGVMFRRSRR